MKLDSARELKQALSISFLGDGEDGAVQPSPLRASALRLLPSRGKDRADPREAVRSLALGISPQGKGFKLAIRIQRRGLETSREVASIKNKAKGEVDLQYVGRIQKLTAPWTQRKQRPLLIGCSIGHYRVTAGTLGCFVRPRGGGPLMILSNNHVLANENHAKKKDPILQPGDADGGTNAASRVAALAKFIRLRLTESNLVDAAVATLDDGIESNQNKLRGLGTLAGRGPDLLDKETPVAKVGRTTIDGRGRVTAFELDNIIVGYDIGNIRFDNQIEIEGTEAPPFSRGGDSGSIIVDSDNLAVALLFAGGEIGGTNGQGLTYANPIKAVLDALRVELAV